MTLHKLSSLVLAGGLLCQSLAMATETLVPQPATKQGNLSSIGQVATYMTSGALSASLLAAALGGGGMMRWRLGQGDPFLPPGAAQGGLAAAAEDSPWSVWATPVRSSFKNEIAPLTSEGVVTLGLVGLEYRHDDELIAGLSLAFDRLSATTTYNAGDLKGNGYTLAPYLVYQPTPTRAFDISLGVGRANLDALVDGVSSMPVDARRLASVGVTEVKQAGKYLWMLKASYSLISDKVAAFTDSNAQASEATSTQLGQVRLGAQVSHSFGMVTPFVGYYGLFNNFKATGGTLQPKEYNVSGQWQLGLNFSKEPYFASVVSQLEKDRQQMRAYVGVRY